MPYNEKLADRIRKYLQRFPSLEVEEKKMFRGLTFMVNGKMCISVSGENLMCRFDPVDHQAVAEKEGFKKMIMRGNECRGYCYVAPVGFSEKRDFEYWVNLCLAYNETARSSKKGK
jgi:hypothetical protein